VTTSKTISREDLAGLMADSIAAGVEVIGPALLGDGKKSAGYRRLYAAAELRLDLLPVKSLKETGLPPTEPLLRFRQAKSGVELTEVETRIPARLVIGARPCDAAGLAILDKVMNWDYRDEPWNARRKSSTIVSVACSGGDGSCFCHATGTGPDSGAGADLLLTPIAAGFHVEVLTAGGSALVDRHAGRFADGSAAEAEARSFREGARERVAANLQVDLDGLREWLGSAFDSDCWEEFGLRCHGCGACAFVCPTCHCFDIVDEMDGPDTGTRRRNWDTCQTAKFTVHASGHNPRSDQVARIRQRVMHKFLIYPTRFGDTLCTGCGRCARACPAGMDLPEILRSIGERAAATEGVR
jgi:sulfhydrogenase subunit beta (sulfur reductase)